MLAADHGKRVCKLHARFVVTVECAEVMAQQQEVGDIEIRLPGHAGKAIIATRPLHKERIDFGIAERGGQGTGQRLIAQQTVARAAGRAHAASIESVANQHVQVGGILD